LQIERPLPAGFKSVRKAKSDGCFRLHPRLQFLAALKRHELPLFAGELTNKLKTLVHVGRITCGYYSPRSVAPINLVMPHNLRRTIAYNPFTEACAEATWSIPISFPSFQLPVMLCYSSCRDFFHSPVVTAEATTRAVEIYGRMMFSFRPSNWQPSALSLLICHPDFLLSHPLLTSSTLQFAWLSKHGAFTNQGAASKYVHH
jgi:hypothetical protein